MSPRKLRHPDDLPADFFDEDARGTWTGVQKTHKAPTPVGVSAKCSVVRAGRVTPDHANCTKLNCACPCHGTMK